MNGRGSIGAALLCAGLAAGCSRPSVPPADTLAILQERDVEGLDPHTGGNLWQTQNVLANLYEGVVALDAGMRVVPALATQWTNPDDTTLELTLRSGVVFHDGAPLGPDDVVWSFERARRHPRSLLRATLADVLAVERVGADRVRIRTGRPDASLATRLRDVAVVSRTCAERVGEAGLETTSCGTGAYRLAGRTAGLSVDLERFDRHWAGPPDIPRVRFLGLMYGDPRQSALVTPATRLVFYARPGTDGYGTALQEAVLHRGSGLGVSYLGFDLEAGHNPAVTHPDGSHRNPFRDRRVREAVALAVDHVAANRAVYGGDAVVATQFVPGLVFGFDRDLPEPRRDLGRARELLASTPFAAGFEVRLDARRIMERYGEPLRAALADLGLRVKLELLEEEPFFERVRGGRSALYLLRFSCRSGDAQEILDKWVHSKDEARGLGRSNHSYDRSPVPGLDAAIEAARVELRPAQRAQMLSGILRRVQEEHLVVPLLQDLDFTFASPDVEWHPRADTYRIARDARFRR